MRRIVCLLAIALLPAVPALAASNPQSTPAPVHTPTSLPRAKAEPENGGNYLPPAPMEKAGPSQADRGPAQKHFVLAATTDDLEQTQVADNASLVNHEPMALDPKVKVLLIHDVQDDGGYKGSENHALQYEIEYLNWGAETLEQLQAREGHYFTITWANRGPKSDFTARIEYRQVKSKEIVRTLTQPMPHVDGTTRSYFAVVDKAYQAYGPVYSWRISILKGQTIVAQEKSFVW